MYSRYIVDGGTLTSAVTPVTSMYSQYIVVGGQAMEPWERDTLGYYHEPKPGSIFQCVVSDNGAFVCLAADSAFR